MPDKDALVRVREMAEESLPPEYFEMFADAYDCMVDTRSLDIPKIEYGASSEQIDWDIQPPILGAINEVSG